MPNSGQWEASNNSRFKTPDEYRDYLYSDERMGVRTEIFINQSLPILAKASVGYGYYHVVTYQDLMPAKFQHMLEDAAERYPFLALDKIVDGVGTMNSHRLLHRLHSPGKRMRGQPFGLFRLDDDDLLTMDYFDQMAPHIRQDTIGQRVSLGRGITALYRDGKYENIRNAYRLMNSMGLLSVGVVDASGKLILPPDVAHNRSDSHGTVIVNSERQSWLWVRHAGQDTALREDGADLIMEELEQYTPTPENVDLAAMFPGVRFVR